MHDDSEFKVKSEHIELLRHMYVDWSDCESGAPCINPKRPYGNSNVIKDIAKILGYSYRDIDSEIDGDELWRLHLEMDTVLQIYLCMAGTGELFTKGKYYKSDSTDRFSWVKYIRKVPKKIVKPKFKITRIRR